jgi:hypothetical protein
VVEAIQNQINTLHEALSSHLLITSIIEGDCEHMTENQTIAMREHCQIVALALFVAIDNLPIWENWNRCCEVAVGITSKMGIVTSRNARVVRNWYQKFRVKRKFQLWASVNHDLPPFLERNKEICISLKTYIREHLADLSSEMVCDYLHNTVLPMLVKEDIGLEQESDGYVDAVRTVLGKYGLTKICPSTCCRQFEAFPTRNE